MGVLWDDRAWEEYLSWQSEDKKTLKKREGMNYDTETGSIPAAP